MADYNLDMTGAEFCAMINRDRATALRRRTALRRMHRIEALIRQTAIRLITFIIVIGLIFCAGYITSPASIRDSRTEAGVVTDKNGQGSIVIKTQDGNLWGCNDESLFEGDKLYVTFDTNKTHKKSDDKIIWLQQR